MPLVVWLMLLVMAEGPSPQSGVYVFPDEQLCQTRAEAMNEQAPPGLRWVCRPYGPLKSVRY